MDIKAKVTNLDDDISMNGLHFNHFASIPEYREVNRSLIREVVGYLPNPFFHVDIATGTGLVPQILMEEATARGYTGHIIGVDRNDIGLDIARQSTPTGTDVTVEYILGDARGLRDLLRDRIPAEGVDGVSIHDAIHEIDGEDAQRGVYRDMGSIAKCGAVLSCNSSFTTRSMAPGHSLRGHGEWKLHFTKLTGAKRNRDIPTMPYRTPEDYKQMIRDEGFEVIHDQERIVQLSKTALKAISMYPAFISGVGMDLRFDREYSTQELSDFMCEAVDMLRFDSLPRIWHEIIGRKQPA